MGETGKVPLVKLAAARRYEAAWDKYRSGDFRLALEELAEKGPYLTRLRELLVTGIKERISHVIYTGHPQTRLPGHASFCLEGIEGEALLFMLSRQGIYANTGSACAVSSLGKLSCKSNRRPL